jgi:uncharacterized cupredoxin-like copper-binding protein
MSRAATLTLELHPPVITQDPVDVEDAANGAKVSFTVKADGAKSYQWYAKGLADEDFAPVKKGTKATLTVKVTPDLNGTEYRCKAINADGDDMSKAATLTVVLHPPVIDTDPEDVTVNNGGSAEFTVAATGAKSYQWYVRTSEEAEWTAVKKATKATLTLKATPAMNGYQYRADAINGDGPAESNFATLTVTDHKPVIPEGQLKDEEADSGTSVTFSAEAEYGQSYQWYSKKPGAAKWSKVKKATQPTLTVTATKALDGMQYYCEVKNGSGLVQSNIVTLTVIVRDPEIKDQPKDKEASDGDSVTFTVSADYASSYQWYSKKPGAQKWSKVKKATKPTLTIKVKSSLNGYQYRCAVSNADSTIDSDAATLTVK